MLKAKGNIIYDPKRPGLKKNTKWWIVLETNNGIMDFYRWLILKGKGFILHKPSWPAHVTVVRGEEPKNKSMWKAFQNEEIEFEYSYNVRYSGDTVSMKNPELNGTYWFIDIYSDRLSEIRQSLGLSAKQKYHLTVGRV